jgi:hypothetical protein
MRSSITKRSNSRATESLNFRCLSMLSDGGVPCGTERKEGHCVARDVAERHDVDGEVLVRPFLHAAAANHSNRTGRR